MLLTEISILMQPFLLGKSIDGLILGGYHWLILFAISLLISTLFNYKRMIYDTKVYTQIYNDIVLRFLKKDDVATSSKVARTDMAHDIVGVLEGYVHYYIATIVTMLGSIFFIFSSSYQVGLLVVLASILIMFSVYKFYPKIRQSIIVRNNQYEKKVDAITKGYDSSYTFFNRKRKLDIFESTLQGKSWLSVGVIKNVFLVLSLIVLINTTTVITVGGVITIYSYVNNFLISLMSIPVAVEMYSRLSDILKRVG
jgi:hypothetical protein